MRNSSLHIPEVPDIDDYQEIKDASLSGDLIIFIGAGVSSILGCLRWVETAEHLLHYCREISLITFWEEQRMLGLYKTNPRKMITIAKSRLSKSQYQKQLKVTLCGKRKLITKMPVYKILSGINAIYVTTNIDNHFRNVLKNSNTYCQISDFKGRNLRPGRLFHLHGHRSDMNKIVFTIDEYIRHYNKKVIRNFLYEIFTNPNKKYCLLFLGYGLEELEIVDFMFGKTGEKDTAIRSPRKKYMLFPFFSAEKELLAFEKTYYEKMGIELVPYSIDRNGYERQLFEIIRIWQSHILPSDFYKKAKLIDEVI